MNKAAGGPKILKLFSYFAIVGVAILFLADISYVYAVDLGVNYAEGLGLPQADPRVAIVELVRVALTFLGIIAVIIIMYAGYLWTVSGGNEEKIARAKRTLINAIIGLVIILSAFLIVNFVLTKLNESLTPGGPGSGRRPGGISGGIGALGNCAIESVYPEPNQRDVPRNTGIIVTFMTEVDPVSVCGASPCNASNIITDGRIKLYKSSTDPDNPDNWITGITVSSTDNKTFFFDPLNNLGSPSENIRYAVYLSNSIVKLDGSGGVFDDCGVSKYFDWEFEVSTRIDLVPPQVISVFPPPDDSRDASAFSAPEWAAGTITVSGAPVPYSPASVAGVSNSGGGLWSTASAEVGSSCGEDALHVTVTGGLTAELRRGDSTGILLGAGTINADGTRVSFSHCDLVLSINSGTFLTECPGNCLWGVDIDPLIAGDRLTVGNIIYVFTGGAPGSSQIQIGATAAGTAANINSALAGNSAVTSSVSGTVVTVRAAAAGRAGNNIALTTNSSALALNPASGHLEGGADGGVTVTVIGLPDKARNAVIKVTFNEAINPASVSGDAADLSNYIRVVNMDLGANLGLGGRFTVSNGYRTVEFRSDNLCGVNGCGEPVYCLPELSHLRVELIAASLASCPGQINCSAVPPYTTCTGGHCQNAAGENYPLADMTLGVPPNGVADAANNSLDGNRDGNAAGPGAFYDENTDSGAGDNYRWSFYISGTLDLTPPVITSVSPAHNDAGVLSSEPVRIDFNKLMMSSTLRPGSVKISDGRDNVTHKLINIGSYTGQSVGYWVTSDDMDNNGDLIADFTRAEVRHSDFPRSTTFRAQVGSGVKDIYQNCFRPSSGTSCDGNPSCCGNTPTTGSVCP